MPESDVDFPGRWREIKTAFSNTLPTAEPRSSVMTSRGERGLWQRRYWEHSVREYQEFAAHLGLHAFQSRQARSGEAPGRLAAVIVSSARGQRAVSGRVDGLRRATRDERAAERPKREASARLLRLISVWGFSPWANAVTGPRFEAERAALFRPTLAPNPPTAIMGHSKSLSDSIFRRYS